MLIICHCSFFVCPRQCRVTDRDKWWEQFYLPPCATPEPDQGVVNGSLDHHTLIFGHSHHLRKLYFGEKNLMPICSYTLKWKLARILFFKLSNSQGLHIHIYGGSHLGFGCGTSIFNRKLSYAWMQPHTVVEVGTSLVFPSYHALNMHGQMDKWREGIYFQFPHFTPQWGT